MDYSLSIDIEADSSLTVVCVAAACVLQDENTSMNFVRESSLPV